jgi:hypothetical protein
VLERCEFISFFGDENWIFKSIYGVDFDVEAELVLFVR